MKNIMKKYNIRQFLATGLLVLNFPITAQATGGYWSLGFGTNSKGMAGTGVALELDALSAGINPAAMALVGNRFDLGMALFFPKRGFTANSPPATQNCPPLGPTDPGCITPGEYTSKNSLFFIPHFGWNRALDPETTIGISLGGNGGMNTEYNSAIFQNYNNPFGTASSPTGIDLSQLFLGITYSRKIAENNWIGITPVIAIQNLKVTGLEPFAMFTSSQTTAHLTNQGYDWSYGYGLRLGWLGQITPQLNLGLSYQTRIYMSKFDKYSELLAEQGAFDIPPTMTLGFAFKFNPELTALFDYQKIWYGKIRALANSNLPGGPFNLGGDDGLGFGWNDQDIFKLGLQWRYNSDLTVRAGFAHAAAVFQGNNAFFNILAPATVENHLTSGFTYRLNAHDEITGSLTYALNKQISGTNPMFSGAQTGFVEMNQTELEFSWARRF